MARTQVNDTYEAARETTVAAARQFGEGFGQAAGKARNTSQHVSSFRDAVRDQPLVMAAVMLGVGYFLRTILYPAAQRRKG